MALEELRKKLLFNALSDVWIAYCEERGGEWTDFSLFKKFVKFLGDEGVKFKGLGVCPTGTGPKAELSKKASILLGDPQKSFVVKTDDATVEKIRRFPLK